MNMTDTLDLKSFSRFSGRSNFVHRLFYLVAAIILIALAIAGSSPLSRDGAQAAVSTPLEQVRTLTALTKGRQSELLKKGESAQARNALIPIASLPIETPGRFQVIRPGERGYEAALKCLSQAIYYEAAREPLEGKRAVAQVVINRLRHPAYPNSVCGVVYEGSNQRVCQFSFTCDGSLLRPPVGLYWKTAKRVAADVLTGQTQSSTGTATHYHADYVLPRWAFTLAKIEKIGAHIFYRFPGKWGGAKVFRDRWSGRETIPELDIARLRAVLARSGVSERFSNGLTVPPNVTDRHAASDIGGRLDTTKTWRLTIPLPGETGQAHEGAVPEHKTIAIKGEARGET